MTIDGKKIAEEVLVDLKKEIADKNLELSLGAVLVGDDPEFKKFVDLKGGVAEKAGISFTTYKFEEKIETEELRKNMREICQWSDGALVELPLPRHIDQQAILNEVPVEKDVDVLSGEAQKLFYDNKSKVNSPAVEALKIIFEKYNINLKGKKATVFGFGILVGKPVAHWLKIQGADVSVIRSKTENPAEISKNADIVVSGVGKPGLVTEEMVKKDAVVIDFGYGRDAKGKMSGDIDYNPVSSKASLITPVPGGMGPILIAAVLRNLIILNVK